MAYQTQRRVSNPNPYPHRRDNREQRPGESETMRQLRMSALHFDKHGMPLFSKPRICVKSKEEYNEAKRLRLQQCDEEKPLNMSAGATDEKNESGQSSTSGVAINQTATAEEDDFFTLPAQASRPSYQQELSPSTPTTTGNVAALHSHDSKTPDVDNDSDEKNLIDFRNDSTAATSAPSPADGRTPLANPRPRVDNVAPPERAGLATSALVNDSNKPPFPRQRNPQRGRKPLRKRNEWPKAKDLRPGTPRGSSSDQAEHAAPRTWADYAKMDPRKTDPNYDVNQLLDWDGGWLPGPVEWEERAGFVDYSFKERIDVFLNALQDVSVIDITHDFYCGKANYEIASRSWVPETVDGSTASAWWSKHVRSKLCECQPDALPWWQRYLSPQHDYVKDWPCPEASLDEVDLHFGSARNEASCTAEAAIKTLLNNRKRKVDRKKHREMQDRMGLMRTYVPVLSPDHIKVKGDIFLREAYQFDITQITDIYNHHVRHTVHVPERSPIDVPAMRLRQTDMRDRCFPFIVAIDKARRANDNEKPHPAIERVVGFAFADDYHSREGMYRYTCELEMYLDSSYYGRGIGSCLMDRMNYLLDPRYNLRGGYQFVGEGPKFFAGGTRVVDSIICHIPYDPIDETRITWLGPWLVKHKFKKVGDIPEIGVKLHQPVNMAIYYRKTGSNVNPARVA